MLLTSGATKFVAGFYDWCTQNKTTPPAVLKNQTSMMLSQKVNGIIPSVSTSSQASSSTVPSSRSIGKLVVLQAPIPVKKVLNNHFLHNHILSYLTHTELLTLMCRVHKLFRKNKEEVELFLKQVVEDKSYIDWPFLRQLIFPVFFKTLKEDTIFNFHDTLLSFLPKHYAKLTSCNLSVKEPGTFSMKWCVRRDRLEEMISDKTVIAIAERCPNLTSITLRDKSITETAVIALARNCPSLRFLDLSYCEKITSLDIKIIAKSWPQLTFLDLSGCNQLIFVHPRAFAKSWPNLTFLHLRDCKWVSDAVTIAITQNRYKLTTLDLSGCHLFYELGANCRNLAFLDLSSCGHICDIALRPIVQGCPKLMALNLCDCFIRDATLIALAKGCLQLTFLDLSLCTQITDAGLLAIAASCRHLISLSLGSCQQFTDTTLKHVAKCYPYLTSLDLSLCIQVTDNTLKYIVEQCSHLTSLDLSSCIQITDAGLLAIAAHCLHLTSLDLSSCPNITAAGLKVILESCPNLIFLCLRYCHLITEDILEDIKKRYPQLKMEVSWSSNLAKSRARWQKYLTISLPDPYRDIQEKSSEKNLVPYNHLLCLRSCFN